MSIKTEIGRRGFLVAAGAAAVAPALAPAFVSPSRFEPVIGVCRGPGAAAAAKAAGAGYLEISCAGELRPHEGEIGDRLERLMSLPIPPKCANGFLPGSFQATGPAADHDQILAYCKVAFDRARAVGMTTITFGSSGARSVPQGFDMADADLQFTSLLARMAPLAADQGVTVCVENLRHQETNYINRVDHAARIVGAIDHPNIRITADIYHMLVEGEGPDSIRAAGDLIGHLHIAEKEGRRAPGTSGEDFTPYLRALADIEYGGLLSIECGWRDFDAEVSPSIAALRSQIMGLD